jgi:hypothetical protein
MVGKLYPHNGTHCRICGIKVGKHLNCDICGVLLGKRHYGGGGRTVCGTTLTLVDEYGVFDDWKKHIVEIDTYIKPLIVCGECLMEAPGRSLYRKKLLKKQLGGRPVFY